jgi:hypothetical protein
MATMLASKGRFLVLAAGLLAIAVYLGIALSWSEGLPKAQFAESKSEQPTIEANDAVIEVEEKRDESNVNQAKEGDAPTPVLASDAAIKVEEKSGQSNIDQPKEGDVPTASSGSKASQSNGATASQITTQTSKTNTETVSHTLATTADTSVKVASNPANALDETIDPDVPGIAKLALTADFQSLVESGVDVSTAVRFIDERIHDGKYGDEITRK